MAMTRTLGEDLLHSGVLACLRGREMKQRCALGRSSTEYRAATRKQKGPWVHGLGWLAWTVLGEVVRMFHTRGCGRKTGTSWTSTGAVPPATVLQ
jgi:hypothetical protein